MQNLKNIFVGFLVSFIGSIPLGYLNVVGFQVYEKSGLSPTVLYLLGVIIIEFFVIYFLGLRKKTIFQQPIIMRHCFWGLY